MPRRYLEILLNPKIRVRRRFKGKRGDAFVFLVVIFSIFIVGLYYITMEQARDLTFTGINSSVGGIDSRANNTMLLLNSVWQWLPLIFLFCIFIWAIVNSLRSKDYGQY